MTAEQDLQHHLDKAAELETQHSERLIKMIDFVTTNAMSPSFIKATQKLSDEFEQLRKHNDRLKQHISILQKAKTP